MGVRGRVGDAELDRISQRLAPRVHLVRVRVRIRVRVRVRVRVKARCTLRIFSRPLRSGRSTGTRRSKRPGRRRAGSRMSARLVAASTMTPELPSKPSISVRIWSRLEFRVRGSPNPKNLGLG